MAGKKIQVTLPEKTVRDLEQISKEKGLSKSIIIALALDDYFKKGDSDGEK